MSVTGYIITGLVVVIVAILGIGAIYINYERRKYERRLTEQAKEAAENEKRKADIITEADVWDYALTDEIVDNAVDLTVPSEEKEGREQA